MRPNYFEKKRNAEFLLMYSWISELIEGKKLYINNKEALYVIYGCGDLSDLIVQEFKNQNIGIEFFIDRNAEKLRTDNHHSTIYTLEEAKNVLNEEYIIIVTIVNMYDEIKKEFSHMCKNVIPIEDVVFEMYQ